MGDLNLYYGAHWISYPWSVGKTWIFNRGTYKYEVIAIWIHHGAMDTTILDFFGYGSTQFSHVY